MNILATIDSKYLRPLITMLISMGETNSNIDIIDVYVAHSSLKQDEIDSIFDAVSPFENMVIHPLKVSDEYFTDTPVIERLPKESFYRLIAFEILPKSVKRCIYLDPDTYILRSLKDLYETDMGDNFICAGSHTYSWCEALNHIRLKMGKKTKYINSGIMLMDLEKMRESTSVTEIMTYVNENIQRLVLGDQDAMNGLFWENTMYFDIRLYNMDEKTLLRYKLHNDYVRENTVIIHYNGKYKPWNEGYVGELDEFYPPVENKGPEPKGNTKKKIKAYFQIFKLNKKQKIVLSIGLAFWVICIGCYFAFSGPINNLLALAINNPQEFQSVLDKFNGFDKAVFVGIRAIQTAIKVIPAEPLEIGSGYAYGAYGGLGLCLLGNIIGSIFILLLTKKFGKKIVDIFFPSEKIANMSLLQDKSKAYTLLFILYLIPGTPKDGFTYLVGLTDLNLIRFMILTSISRIPSIITSTWVGQMASDRNYLWSIIIFVATFIVGVGGSIIYNKYFGTGKEKRKEKKLQKSKAKFENTEIN